MIGVAVANKQELEQQITKHKIQISNLEAMLEDVPTQIKQLKATIKLKKKAIAEKE